MENKKQIQIIDILKKHFPNAHCQLRYKTPMQLLVATILSAQCTDKMVNEITKSLFEKYSSAEDFASLKYTELERWIFSSGFYKTKARYIINTAKILIEKYKGEIPKKMEDLLALPGVARKTANVIRGELFGLKEGIVVDTHVSRIAYRLGWTKSKNTKIIEKDLMQIIPQEFWILISHLLIEHGRKFCQARNPKCQSCILFSRCPRKGLVNK